MIERYTREQMRHIFSLENKYALWTEIEVLACEAQAQLGQIGITADEAAWIREHAGFSVERIDEIEATTNHDVIAFLTDLGEHIDAELPEGTELSELPEDNGSTLKPSRWVHYGMTSSDLGDTALCCQTTQALDLIATGLNALIEITRCRALETKDVLCVGRTHGIHAEPMTFGMKFASWTWALRRAVERVRAARVAMAVGAISGAVGSYSSIDPFVEEYVCEHLGLVPDPLSTQVVARDRHAQAASALAIAAASLEQIATEVRALQKSDTLEAEEPFTLGQKGSSAMPHKRNPITCERVCGLARVVKANTQVALDDVALWHERDISHSSAERVAFFDSFIALDYMLAKMRWVLEGLVIYPENCRANLERTRGLIFSSKVLLTLVDGGLSREDAYTIVQRNAMAVWDDIQNARPGASFRERIEADPEAPLSAEQLDVIFDPWAFLGQIDLLFKRL
ncbi:MAG: adenylosuccinate lyase [Coriobacteriales bacterium]|jgi:adenylosuccinate lyase|nr:adenylosuccinate lyase [Coriobacteriales bacterium]